MDVQRSSRGQHPSLGSRIVASTRAHPNVSLALIVLGAAAGYVAATVLWPGRRAQVAAAVDAVAVALREGDVPAVMEHVSPDFYADDVTRDSLLAILEKVLPERPLVRVSVSVREVEIDGNRANAKVHVTTRYETSRRAGLSRTGWYVTLERDGDRWLIVEALPVHVGGRGAAGLGSFLRTAQ